MDKTEYNKCMRPFITGSKPKEQRKLDFCIGAKICSEKAKDREEAQYLCSLPKEPKPPTKRDAKSRKYAIDSNTLAACVIKTLDSSEITLGNLTTIIADCTGQKVEKPPSREKFIKKCFRENQVTGDIKEAQKLRSFCIAKWKEQEVPL